MKFEFSTDDWHFNIQVNQAFNYNPDGKFSVLSNDTIAAWKKGNLNFFNIVIKSSKKSTEHLKETHIQYLTHYASGVPLPTRQDELQEELEILLEEESYIDHILRHWDLAEQEDGPDWKKE